MRYICGAVLGALLITAGLLLGRLLPPAGGDRPCPACCGENGPEPIPAPKCCGP